jgi:signal transduction histidine kinase/CheY-like chemotaxis protein
VALLMGNLRTAAGRGVDNQHAVEFLSAEVPVPLYTAWQFAVGHGAVGGSVMAGSEQGRLAAQIALRVLQGERPRDIPVDRNVGNHLMVDHQQVKRFGLGLDRVPKGTDVINSPDRSYRISREGAWFVLCSLAVLAAAVISLGVNVRRRRRAEADLTRANRQLEQDIADRHRLEQQLVQSQKLESVGLLAAGIAHDFNNLLTPILSYSDVLLLELDGDPRRAWIADMNIAAKRASELVRQLLAYGRRQVLELRTLDLAEVVRRFEPILRRVIEEHVRIELRFAPSVGPVRADAGQIEQTLLNLAINARDAMPEGGVLTIALSEVVLRDTTECCPELGPGAYVVLEVTDTGSGMTEEVQRHLFDPFFTTKEVGKGSGLGLPTAYGIVKQHGGSIVARSRAGEGSTFAVYLPRAEAPVEPVAKSAVDGPAPRGRETVLVVEDDDMVRTLATELLGRLGYRVLAAHGGHRALEVEASYEDEIHLLVTDVVLPRMNGKEVATRLGERRPGLKVLYVSGYAPDLVDHAARERVNFLAKPLTLDSLARKVRAVLDA